MMTTHFVSEEQVKYAVLEWAKKRADPPPWENAKVEFELDQPLVTRVVYVPTWDEAIGLARKMVDQRGGGSRLQAVIERVVENLVDAGVPAPSQVEWGLPPQVGHPERENVPGVVFVWPATNHQLSVWDNGATGAVPVRWGWVG